MAGGRVSKGLMEAEFDEDEALKDWMKYEDFPQRFIESFRLQ
jgi:hypothetical protein